MELLEGLTRGLILGAFVYLFLRVVLGGFFTVAQAQRAVLVSFGRAQTLGPRTKHGGHGRDQSHAEDGETPYEYPRLVTYQPGGPYFKWPWQKVIKVPVATQTMNMAFNPDVPSANQGGTVLEAVTKDQLNTGLSGQLRYRISEKNLYPYLFGVKSPLSHIVGYFHSILRERIAKFEAPAKGDEDDPGLAAAAAGVSLNDLRKNLRGLNEHMDRESQDSERRYGIVLDASLITGIDPPREVESALAAINTAHNAVSSDISVAHAEADQKLVQSRRAVEIETLNAQAEVEPLMALSQQLLTLKRGGRGSLKAYLRNARMALYSKADHVVMRFKNV